MKLWMHWLIKEYCSTALWGTELQKLNPTIDDYPDKQVGFGDGLILTHPEWIKTIHESYLNAGADVIETNTFGSNGIMLRRI